MKKIATAFCILGIALLEGCASTAPKLSHEELEAKKTATLNVYEDNRVVLKTFDPGDRGLPRYTRWSWTADKDTILALYIDDSVYNVKDISRIISQRNNNNQDLVVYFKSGEKKAARAGRTRTQDGGIKYFGPMWVSCNAKKECSDWYHINDMNPSDLGNILTAIYEEYLSAQSYQRDPKFELMPDSRAIPKSDHFQNVIVLDDAGRADFEKRMSEMNRRWAAQKPQLAASRAETEAKANARDKDAHQQAKKAGKINCASTSYSCTTNSYSDITRLECGTFRSSVGDMKRDGWVVANVNSELVRANLGEMCDHNVYHFYYKR